LSVNPIEGVSSRILTTFACGLLLLVAGLVGGGRGGLGDTLAQLIALSLLGWLCWLGAWGHIAWLAPAWVRWLPVLALVLPLLQLMPVPESVWTLGAARSELAAQLGRAGIGLPSTLSLNPAATESALWSLLPAVAIFLAALTLSRRGHQVLLVVVVTLAIANVVLGMAQVAGGTGSPLRLYAHTNPDQAVGFFANRNHLASLLVMTLPIALAWTGWSVARRLGGGAISPIRVIAACVLVVALILGVALSRSRAGVLFGMLAVLGSLPIVLALGPRRGTRRILAATLAVAVMIAIQFSLLGAVHRIDMSSLDDGRWSYTTTTLRAATAYAPLGSGLGTFRQAYLPFEAKGGQPTRYIVNHAHNDYVELWLEGGALALLLIAAALSAWAFLGWRLFRARGSHHEEVGILLVARAAWWAGTLALMHSALDYPLRTTAASAVFALLAGIAFSALPLARRRA
jgi:hypothetical protein